MKCNEWKLTTKQVANGTKYYFVFRFTWFENWLNFIFKVERFCRLLSGVFIISHIGAMVYLGTFGNNHVKYMFCWKSSFRTILGFSCKTTFIYGSCFDLFTIKYDCNTAQFRQWIMIVFHARSSFLYNVIKPRRLMFVA